MTTTERERSAIGRLWARAEAAVCRPVDIAGLAAFRVLFGLTMLVSMLRFLAYGWIDELFVKPGFHFKYYGFGWVPAPTGAGMHALFWALAGLALFISIGFCFRLAAFAFFVGFSCLQLVDVATYLNHYYLAALLSALLMLSPAHRAWSVDASLRRQALAEIPAGFLYLFRLQVGVVYAFAGIAKAHADWLYGAQPLGIWLSSHTDFPLLGPLFSFRAVAYAMSWAGFLFDSTIVLWLSLRRTRPYAYVAVVAFHAFTRALFPIGMFPVIMVLSALVFFEPGWPRPVVERLRSVLRLGPTPVPAPYAEPRAGLLRHAALGVAAAYCAFQVLFPLRFVLYGGNVRWHEQGMRFSWRVMVREKNGSITFVVKNPETGRVWHVTPTRYLTQVQAREMSGQPDLILQLAHHIRADFERQGKGPVEVRVDAQVSLNGRRIAKLIDPEVDLSRVDDGLERAGWILPEPDGPPAKSGKG